MDEHAGREDMGWGLRKRGEGLCVRHTGTLSVTREELSQQDQRDLWELKYYS